MTLHQRTLNLILLGWLSSVCLSQPNYLLQHHPGTLAIGHGGKDINSIANLPAPILDRLVTFQDKLPKYFRSRMEFSDGYFIDLDKLDPDPRKPQSGYQWEVPAYVLHFVFSDSSVGIARYFVELYLDKEGEVFKSNLPTEGFLQRLLRFVPWGERSYTPLPLARAIELARNYAHTNKLKTDSMTVNLIFDKHRNRLKWSIDFLQKIVGNRSDYTSIRVDFQIPAVIETYQYFVYLHSD